MAWQNLGQNEVNSAEDNVLVDLPVSDAEAIDFSSQWLFTLDPTAPTWPHDDYETLFSATSQHLPSPPVDDVPWNAFDENFGDATMWEQWDPSKGFGNDRSARLDVQGHSYGTTAKKFHLIPNSRPCNQVFDSDDISIRSTPQSSCEGLKLESSAVNVPVAGFGASQFARGLRMDKSIIETGIPSLVPVRTMAIQLKSRTRKIATSKPSLIGSSHLHQTQSHKVTEKRYRSKLNDEFSTLLQALPDKHIAAIFGGELGTAVSKVETLHLAKTHIGVLETEQEQLNKENIVLKGQVCLFEKMFNVPRE
jgi:hypothetical protein